VQQRNQCRQAGRYGHELTGQAGLVITRAARTGIDERERNPVPHNQLARLGELLTKLLVRHAFPQKAWLS
jgi:hypothetical protein